MVIIIIIIITFTRTKSVIPILLACGTVHIGFAKTVRPLGQRVQNAKVLGFMCDWKPLQESETYMILTDSLQAKDSELHWKSVELEGVLQSRSFCTRHQFVSEEQLAQNASAFVALYQR